MTRTVDELLLDGMPEPQPAWIRPDRAVRMSALQFDHMLLAALAHVGDDEELPILMSISLEITAGQLVTRATDRYSLIRERRLVSQTCDDFRFLLRSEDARNLRVLLKSVLRGMKAEEKDVEPVDIALEQTDDGPTLRVLGQDLDVRFTEQDEAHLFPNSDRILDRTLTALYDDGLDEFETYINPMLLSRVGALQQAGRGTSMFLFRKPPGQSPVVVTTLDEDDDVVLALMPVRVGDGGEK
jgi:hypothetical protein